MCGCYSDVFSIYDEETCKTFPRTVRLAISDYYIYKPPCASNCTLVNLWANRTGSNASDDCKWTSDIIAYRSVRNNRQQVSGGTEPASLPKLNARTGEERQEEPREHGPSREKLGFEKCYA